MLTDVTGIVKRTLVHTVMNSDKTVTTFDCYSQRVYEYYRRRIPLPATSTLRRWLITVYLHPGFSGQVLSFLKDKVEGGNSWQYKSCSVMIDGMSIRKHIDWDPVRYSRK